MAWSTDAARRPVWFALVLLLVSACASDPWVEHAAVTIPSRFEEVRSLSLGGHAATLLADDRGCVRLVVEARGRQQRDADDACREGAFRR